MKRVNRHANLRTLLRYDDSRRDEAGAIARLLGETSSEMARLDAVQAAGRPGRGGGGRSPPARGHPVDWARRRGIFGAEDAANHLLVGHLACPWP